MEKYEEYQDANGVSIGRDTRVRIAGSGKPDFETNGNPPEFFTGVIVVISDPDGDVDDEGRSIGIPPAATVLFDDGEEDTFTGEVPREYYPEMAYGYMEGPIPYVFEDIEVIK